VSLRVAIVTESFLPQINGVTNSVIRVLETFKQKEIESVVVAPTSGSSRHLGFEVLTVPSLPVMQFPVALPSPVLWRELEAFNPDVIHVAAPFLLGYQSLLWARRSEVPSVAIYQTDVAGYLSRYNLSFAKPAMDRITASIHSLATLNLTPTKDSANYLSSLGVENVSIWGRGVDHDLFNPANKLHSRVREIRNAVSRPGELLVGFVGRLAAEKQVGRMMELFDVPNTRFLIVGDGPERVSLEQQFAGKKVTFVGAKSGLELAHHYGALDVFVHFGTEETFGQTIQEAQASGVPVIAPNRGGPKNLIQDGRTGLLVEPDESRGYRKALIRLLSHDVRRTLADQALIGISQKSWANNNSKLLGYYRQAIAMVHARRAAEFELA
jgi:phosphatidylinositol alpha 1,6-mannosyltransferase